MTPPVMSPTTAWLAFAGILAIAVVFFFWMFTDAWNELIKFSSKKSAGFWVAMVVVMAVIAGTKPPHPTVYHDGYLVVTSNFIVGTNIVGGVTNYTATGLSVSWMLSDADLVPIIPTSAPIYIEASSDAGTNYTQIGASTLGTGSWYDSISNATNYRYFVWLDWAPDVPVATNGVYHLDLSQPVPNRYVPLRIKVDVDGETITPSAEDGL